MEVWSWSVRSAAANDNNKLGVCWPSASSCLPCVCRMMTLQTPAFFLKRNLSWGISEKKGNTIFFLEERIEPVIQLVSLFTLTISSILVKVIETGWLYDRTSLRSLAVRVLCKLSRQLALFFSSCTWNKQRWEAVCYYNRIQSMQISGGK